MNFFSSVPPPSSVSVTSTPFSPVNNIVSTVTVNCVVELSPALRASDVSLLKVDIRTSRDGTQQTLTGPTVTGSTFTYTRRFESFGRSNSGNYTCTVNIRPATGPTASYIIGSAERTSTSEITIGVLYMYIRQ